jgi:hypothetical protein
MQKTATTITEFIDSLPENQREDIRKLDKVISAALPQLKKVMWEGIFYGGTVQRIIGYGEYKYTRKKKEFEWFIAGLAPQKNHITVYSFAAKKYKGKVGKVKVGSGSIGFSKFEDVDLEALVEIVKESANHLPS